MPVDPDEALLKPIVEKSISLLTLDIETSPHLVYTFNTRNVFVRPEHIVEPSRILMVGMKWYGEKRTTVLSERTQTHAEMIRAVWHACDQADVIQHYNGRRFDVPHIRREWLLEGLPPPSPFKQVDLYEVVKKFAFPSRKLDAVSRAAQIGAKIEHEGFGLWRKCMEGDEKAWLRMERYCKNDVILTEDVSDWLRPWIHNHPHITNSEEQRCNRCGSANLTPIGPYRAEVLEFAGYRCEDCGGTLRRSNSKRIANTRGTQ